MRQVTLWMMANYPPSADMLGPETESQSKFLLFQIWIKNYAAQYTQVLIHFNRYPSMDCHIHKNRPTQNATTQGVVPKAMQNIMK